MISFRRALAILLVASVLSLAIVQLGRTHWADHVRSLSRPATPKPSVRLVTHRRPNLLLPFIKIAVYMGVPGVATLGVLALARYSQRRLAG